MMTYLLCQVPIRHKPPIVTGTNHRCHSLSGNSLGMIDPLAFDPKWDSVRVMCSESIQQLCNSIGTITIN